MAFMNHARLWHISKTGFPGMFNKALISPEKKHPAWWLESPGGKLDLRYHPKEPVLGIEINGQFKAYPFSELEQASSILKDIVAGQEITVRYTSQNRSANAYDAEGNMLPTVTAFWFAWHAFHPHTDVFTVKRDG